LDQNWRIRPLGARRRSGEAESKEEEARGKVFGPEPERKRKAGNGAVELKKSTEADSTRTEALGVVPG